MILQQLRQDAGYLVDLPPSMYDRKAVRWLVELDREGNADWPPARLTGGDGKKDKGKLLLVPFKNRAGVKAPALLLADKRAFTWGLPADGPRTAAEHERYLDLLRRCAEATDDPDVAAVCRFFERWSPETYPLPEDMEAGDLTTFSVEGRYPIVSPAVQAFWANEAGGGTGEGTPGQCLVCGLDTQVVERLPVALKGIPQGQSSGVAVVSANCSAFESYGRSAALTSPICLDCGERFGKAANELLKNEKRHLNVGPISYLFWTAHQEFDVVSLFSQPDPAQVRLLLESAWKGKPAEPGDDTPFYATALSAAISRAVVRSWLHTTVGEVRENLRRWFELQQLVDAYGTPGAPLSIRRLASSLYRDPQKEMISQVPDCLLRSALHGTPLPEFLLHQAISRIRRVGLPDRGLEGAAAYARMVLIKMLVCERYPGKGERWMVERETSELPAAYHWGRLLAVLERIQRRALERPGVPLNSTIVDRYYGAASTAPGTVFGRLISGAQDHLKKIRGPLKRPGTADTLQRQLESISSAINPGERFQRTLPPREQALFALGYYHERAKLRADARDWNDAQKSGTASDQENGDDHE